MTVEQIAQQAAELTDTDKVRLMDLLWGQVHGPINPAVEEAQVELAKERLAAFERGEDTALDADDVLAQLRKKYLQ